MKGIYLIRNLDTAQLYVGSTLNYDKRVRIHKKALDKNRHHSYKLQKDWSLFTFEFEFIEEVFENSNLLLREQFYIDKLNPYYNICKIAGSSLGVKRTQETKDKVAKANLGLKHPAWRNDIKSKAQGGKLHWTTKKSFSENAKKKMSESQLNLYKNGYVSPRLGLKLNKEQKEKQKGKNSKIIEQYDLSDNLIKCWFSIKEAHIAGYNSKYVIQCCKNRLVKYKKSKWKYKEK